jgi:hypothetical protein
MEKKSLRSQKTKKSTPKKPSRSTSLTQEEEAVSIVKQFKERPTAMPVKKNGTPYTYEETFSIIDKEAYDKPSWFTTIVDSLPIQHIVAFGLIGVLGVGAYKAGQALMIHNETERASIEEKILETKAQILEKESTIEKTRLTKTRYEAFNKIVKLIYDLCGYIPIQQLADVGSVSAPVLRNVLNVDRLSVNAIQ